jgi:hypothetical protein
VDVRGHLGEITNIKVEGPKSVYRNPRLGWLLIVIGVLVFGAFVPSALYLYYHHKDPWSLVIVAAWTVGVPIYFFLEHEIVFFRWGDPTQYERFKSVQAVATKIWAGGIAVLGLIFASAATSGGFPT